MKIGKKIFLMMMGIILSTVLAIGIYGFSVLQYSTEEFGRTFKSYGEERDVITATEPFTILLMGVDTGTFDREDPWQGNSDSMILMTINPNTATTTMMSLERDILTKLDGPEDNAMTGVEAKLNAAYASGQAEMAIETIENLMNINIDRYVQINMQGMIDLVDAVDGIIVNNTFDFPISIEEQEPDYTATIPPGRHKVNGDQALVYARMRYQDPEGDYGRQKRQREVITRIVKKVLSMDSVSRYKKILAAIANNMQTNIEINSETIPSLLGYTDALKHIKNYQLRGQDAYIHGASYQVVTETHLLEMQNILRESVGQARLTELKTNAITFESLYGYSPDIAYDEEGNIVLTDSTVPSDHSEGHHEGAAQPVPSTSSDSDSEPAPELPAEPVADMSSVDNLVEPAPAPEAPLDLSPAPEGELLPSP